MDIFADSGIDQLQLFLDYAARKQQVINSNIANIETPGYQAKQYEFEQLFQEAIRLPVFEMKADRPDHLQGGPILVREEALLGNKVTEAQGNDLNNVDLDREMADLAENVLKFSAVAQIIQMKLQLLRNSMGG